MNIKILFFLLFTIIGTATAQTTAFNFQGRLNDGSSPANGRFDLQFNLFDAIAGGTQVGATVDKPNTTLVNGVFSAPLDFGGVAFASGNRFVEILVRPFNSPNAYVVLGSRQQILSVPLAVRATSAASADTATFAQNAANAQLAALATNAFNADLAATANNANALGGVNATSYARLDIANSTEFRVIAPSSEGTAIRGEITSTNPLAAGVRGISRVNNGTGVRGEGLTGVYGGASTASGYGVFASNPGGRALYADGNAVQPLNSNGFAKAMIKVRENGTVEACYNSQLPDGGASMPPSGSTGCGFTVSRFADNVDNIRSTEITFNFDVGSRFPLATVDRGLSLSNVGIIVSAAGNGVLVGVFLTDQRDSTRVHRPFTIIIF